MTPLRAVLYLRLSVSKEESTSIEAQERVLLAHAKSEGWAVARIITDDGVSGAKNRASTDAVLELVREGQAEVILVFKMDRWTRSGVSALGRLFDVLEECPGSRFIAVKDNLDSAGGDQWDLMAPVMSALAKREREAIRLRVSVSIEQRHRAGRFVGGNVPFGYSPAPAPSGPGRVLVPNSTEASIVREMASRVLDGESLYAISHDLNVREVPTRRGKTWSVQAIRQILTSDVILGRVTYKGDLLRDDEGLPLTVWEPVLDLDKWAAVCKRLPAHVSGGPKRKPRSPRVLSGIPTCALCNARLYVKINGSGTESYACTQRASGRTCPGVSVAAAALEEYIADVFLRTHGDDTVYDLVAVVDDGQDLAEVKRAIAQTSARLGEVDDEATETVLHERLAALKARRRELTSRPAGPEVTVAPTGETVAGRWDRSDLAGRHEMLTANLAVLVISKGRRGPSSFDPSRVQMMWQPAFPAEHANALARPVPGRVVAPSGSVTNV